MRPTLAPQRPAMRLRLPLLVSTLLLAAACIEPLETPNSRYGAIALPSYAVGDGFVVRPEAAFYDRTDLSYEPFTNDTCLVTGYSPTNNIVSGTLRFMNAGDFLFTSVGGQVDSLVPLIGNGFRVYTASDSAGIPLTPGDTMVITIPGAAGGFPASAITVRTAEAFTHGGVGVPGANTNLPLTWDPAPVPGSQMTFSLRYANLFATNQLNEQVFCSFIDDGSATIPAIYLSGWISAQNDLRESRVTRVRSNQVRVDARTLLAAISTFTPTAGGAPQ